MVDIRKKYIFLAIPNAMVLDNGSGVRRFYITADTHFSQTRFIGIEQRKELYHYAEIAKDEIGLDKVSFIYGNITACWNFSSFLDKDRSFSDV